jgi:hypothetical protein
MKEGQASQIRLTRKQVRQIEIELGVYLGIALSPIRSAVQQFAVYTDFNEEERFVADIHSQGRHFSAEELRIVIRKALEPFTPGAA